MPRINVEDSIESTHEWRKLLKLLDNNEERAMGMLVYFWRHAQRLWGHGELIPKEDMEERGWITLIQSKWAVEREPGRYYARGAADQFAWYAQRVEAAKSAGRPSNPPPEPEEPGNREENSDFRKDLSGNPLLFSSPLSSSLHTSTQKKSALPHLAEIWNQNRGELSEVRGCSGTRKKHAELRWREVPSPEYWAKIVLRIARSPFCSGDNDRGWRADFDFLIRPETRHKVEEGKYDPRPPSGPNGRGPVLSAEVKAEMAALEKMRKDCNEGRL